MQVRPRGTAYPALCGGLLVLFLLLVPAARAAEPVLIGFDSEAGHLSSTSDDAIRLGITLAIEEINAAGGVLGGRPLQLVEKDHRSIPARGLADLREFAALRDLVAVFHGKFSRVVLQTIPEAHRLKVPLLLPWSAADELISHNHEPSYTFRLSLRDAWAMPHLIDEAGRHGWKRLGILVPDGAWGRSNYAAARVYLEGVGAELVHTAWYNWTDTSYAKALAAFRDARASALLFVGNEAEAALLIREMAALPENERLPILSHWGSTGGDLPSLAGDALGRVDFAVVQTFSFAAPLRSPAQKLRDRVLRRLGLTDPALVPSAVGVAHAYDLTHLLAQATDRAGSTSRPRIRAALERLSDWEGSVRRYAPAFTPQRHEALGPEFLFMARYRADGALLPEPAHR